MQSNVLVTADRPCLRSGTNPLHDRRQHIKQQMEACRRATLALFQTIDYDTFCQQAHPDFSPIGWHLGHIAYTESLWLLEHSAGRPPQFPQYHRLFAAASLPKAERVYLPALSEVQSYLQTVRQAAFAYLETAPLDEQERLWRWLLQHESQHGETIALVLELMRRQKVKGKRQKGEEGGQRSAVSGQPSAISGQQLTQNSKLKISPSETLREQNSKLASPTPHSPLPSPLSPHPSLLTPLIYIPAGTFECGHDSIEALDNERPVHRVDGDAYWIDRAPVTCEQYQVFIAAGGYEDSQWWSIEGWKWLQSVQVRKPLYWSDANDRTHHPVCGVNWYEADAYAHFVGKRLPTEAEWEKAASWHPIDQQRQTYPWGEATPSDENCNCNQVVGHTTPVGAYPAGSSPFGCDDLLGNVWEWTASWFDGYLGFEAYPYRGYSQAYFDGHPSGAQRWQLGQHSRHPCAAPFAIGIIPTSERFLLASAVRLMLGSDRSLLAEKAVESQDH